MRYGEVGGESERDNLLTQEQETFVLEESEDDKVDNKLLDVSIRPDKNYKAVIKKKKNENKQRAVSIVSA